MVQGESAQVSNLWWKRGVAESTRLRFDDKDFGRIELNI